ncbi:MAG: hypothetical protein ABL904_26340, partial [Hyphomicrobiaceae bacterium]
DLGPGQFRTIEVWVDTGPILIGGNYGFNNCVILRHPNGSRRACHEGGTEIIVEKTGPAVCQPGGLCRYGLTIRNAGDEPYAGPLLLNDHMTSGGAPFVGQIISISQPLGCSPEPTQVPFTCAANVSLAAGEARTIWIEVQLPPGKGGYVLENCFWVTDRVIISNDNLRDRLVRLVKDDRKRNRHFMACVRTRVSWPEKPVDVPFFVPPGGGGFLPPDPVCWNGQIPLPGGRCACPGHTRWDPELGACRQPPRQTCYDPVRMMPNGTCCPWGTRWNSETWSCRQPPRPTCFDPARRMPNGECCPSGTRWDWHSKSCQQRVIVCPNDSRPLPNGLCGCPTGTRWDPITRSCGKPGDPTGGKCPDGSPKAWGGRCKCPEGSVWNIAAQSCGHQTTPPVCRVGTVWNPSTRACEPKANVPKCPLNQPVYNPVTKRCERAGGQPQTCPTGQVRVGDKCVASKLPTVCPTNQHKVGDKCVDNVKPGDCKPGFVRTPSGACLPKSVTERCPTGQVKQADGSCKPLLKTADPKQLLKRVEPKQVPKKIDVKPVPKKVEIKKVPVPRKIVAPPKKLEKATPIKRTQPNQVAPKKAVPRRVVEPKKKLN